MPEIGYEHGVYVEELATALQPLRRVTAPAVVVGTAIKGVVNQPKLINSMTEFTTEFGYTDDWNLFTLEEAAYVFFQLYNIKPIICINICDRSRHVKSVAAREISGVSAPVELTGPIILSTLVVTSGNVTLVSGTDYKTSRDKLKLTLTVLNQNKITGDKIAVSYQEIDITKVTNNDVIGGVDGNGKETGLEALENVYPRTGMVPGSILAPKFSTTPAIAQVMAAKAHDINGVFKTMALCDISSTSIQRYDNVYAHKSANGLVDEHLITCWPKIGLGDKQYHLSTHAAALMCKVDATHEQVPFESPSNKVLRMDRAVVGNNAQVDLSKLKANTLNSQGVVTSLNWAGEWRLWGNRTSIFPSSNDPKDTFISCRRMMNFLCNTLAINYFSRIDTPVNRGLVQNVLDEVGIFLNGLFKLGAILGGRIQFLEEDNPLTDLVDGKLRLSISVGLVPPARAITFILEYDTKYLNELFS